MGKQVGTQPLLFLKPPAAYFPSGYTLALPTWSANVHHELEMVVVIGADAERVAPERAWEVVAGIGVGLDLTARDVQSAAKAAGEPWARAKGWPGAAPVSAIIPASECGKGPWRLWLRVNGELRQHCSTTSMVRPLEALISEVAAAFTLRAGDAIFTGTPEGVAQVKAGDVAQAKLDEMAELTVRFA
jgi:2-keto-4-pentenoate hydratase/2-oxohepta-3-ene-1,7-dioic acid hydratase in catechol pathway